jgi:hypothetical protein
MKRLSLVVLAALGFSLAACGGGGGGGDQDAFCDGLETLSDQVNDGDLADDDGLEDVTDTVNDLLESAADGDQLDAVNAVGDEIEGASADDADDTAETIQDELGDFADDCDIDEDEFAIPATTEPPEETTVTTAPDDETTLPPDDTVPPDTGDAVTVSARQEVPGDIAAEFAGLAQACFDGDMGQCDQLFAQTPVGSVDEAYGQTCGGRLAEARPGECATIITGPADPPAELAPEFVDLANGCAGGDMQACDDLFQQTPVDSIDEAYGLACGGRVPARDVTCVDIFGAVAFA